MRFSDFLPGVSIQASQIDKLDKVLQSQNRFYKALQNYSRTGIEPVGIEQLYFDWLRTAYAYRRMMLQDLYLLAFDITEVRTAIEHLKKAVFRRGFDIWKPRFIKKCIKCGKEFQEEVEHCDECFETSKEARGHKRVRRKDKSIVKVPIYEERDVIDEEGNRIPSVVRDPDPSQYDPLENIKYNCNVFGQSLEEVLVMFYADVLICDDAYLYVNRDYVFEGTELRYAKVGEVRRIHPALVEFDLDKDGLPKRNHFICLVHREEFYDKPMDCKLCGRPTFPVMYIYNHRGKKIYLLESEIIRMSKFSPSETYGYSPLLTLMQKVLTISGMDRFVYRYFFERKTPSGMIVTYTDDPQSLQTEKDRIEARMMEDPTYIPWVAVSQKAGRGRTDFVKFFHTLHEMDYLPVREEIIKRVAMLYGVPPLFTGQMEGVGGISGQTQEMTMFGETVESDQRLFNEKVLPKLVENFGITDWILELAPPREKQEAQILQSAQQKVSIAANMRTMGFDVGLKPGAHDIETLDFEFGGEAQSPMAMGGIGEGMPEREQPTTLGEIQRSTETGKKPIEEPWEEREVDELSSLDATTSETD